MDNLIFPYLRFISNRIIFLFFLLGLGLTSCTQNRHPAPSVAMRQIQIVDSLISVNKGDSAIRLLKKTRPAIQKSDPAISVYYSLRASFFLDKPAIMNLLADSALAFFNTEDRINQYPNEYFRALMIKGDACLKAKKYIAALTYYFKGKQVLPEGNCDNGNIDTKMGGIYYDQKNFRLAARYWAESSERVELCHDKLPPAKLFWIQRGALNNAGFSYELAGVLDSAKFYYLKNLKAINYADSTHLTNKRDIESERVVLYDNLGGLNLKQGHLDTAEFYLDKCMAIPTRDIDGIKITPLIKLAHLYLIKEEYKKAGDAFDKSRRLLDRFYRDNPESEVEWNKLYAAYLFKQHDAIAAYQYQNKYIELRDSVERSSSDLYRLDIERELSSMSQKQTLLELSQKEKIRILYLAGISIIVILFIVIVILINRNLKRAKNNNKIITSQNKQLQQTLDELERVNKNYIRIMRVMAHDLRNPLSGMTGLAAMLLGEDEFSEDSKHVLKLIEATGIHTMEMINELLKSGLADENEPVQKQLIDLKALLFDSVELLQFRASEKQQQILFETNEPPVMSHVNHENIWRVFNNLIVNAIKFSHAGGIIRVSIHHEKNNILIAIADDGIGIPDKDKENIFEMFTPAKKTGTGGEEPFGLGLSISKKIIERHQGKIWFDSKVGEGTTFFIQLEAATTA